LGIFWFFHILAPICGSALLKDPRLGFVAGLTFNGLSKIFTGCLILFKSGATKLSWTFFLDTLFIIFKNIIPIATISLEYCDPGMPKTVGILLYPVLTEMYNQKRKMNKVVALIGVIALLTFQAKEGNNNDVFFCITSG
jgi:hypothetical protein